MRALTWLTALVFFLSVGATTLLLVDPHTAAQLVENWPPLPKEAKAEKVISLVKTNWLFYGTVALFSGFAWVGLVRARRPRRFRRSVPAGARAPSPSALDETPAPAASPPDRAGAIEELLGQFEINWKSFASYTQDLIHRKVQELDGGQKGIKELSDKVSVLGRALEEIRKEISDIRNDAQGAKVSVKDSVPSKDSGELKKLQSELRAAIDKLSGLDERGLKLVKVIEDERQNVVAKLLEEEKRKLERSWSGRVSSLTAQVEEARKESGTLRAELGKERESLASLGRELQQGSERSKKLESDLGAAVREQARRADEARQVAVQLERARKEIEKREKEFAEERRRLCGKVEELEAQGTILESEKSDAESNAARLQSLLDAEGAEREKLQIAAESARSGKDRIEGETRRLTEELKALRTERAQAKAREVVSLGEEKVRLERELEAVRAELAEEREARAQAEKESSRAAPVEAVEDGPDSEELGLELAEARAEAASREDRNRALEAETAALRKQVLEREAEIARLKEAGEAAPRTAKAGADGALIAYRAEIERLELARFDEARRAQTLDEEARKFKARLAELEKARTREDAPAAAPDEPDRLKELEKERMDLLSTLDKLGGELERLRGDIEGFRRFQGALIDGSIPAAISGVDTALKVFAWNPAAEGLWKIDAESVLGRQLTELSLPGFGPDVLSEVERAMREKQTFMLPRSTFVDGSGKVRHVEWSFDPILGPGDESLGAVLITNDVTEKVDREIEARVQALFSQSLLRSLPSALIVLDVERRVISWNLGAERLLGMTEGEVVGKEFFSLPVPLAKPAFQKRFEESERDGVVHRLRVRFDYEGATGNFAVTQAPFVGNDESVRGSMLIIESLAVPVAAK